MAAKIKIWKTLRPFTLDRVDYQPGDEWAQPAGWERIENHPTLHQDGQTVFGFRVQAGFSRGMDGKGQTPEYQDHTVILPVAENA